MTKKLVMVTTEWAPFSDKLSKICEEEASKLGIEFELRKEDWIYLTRYGEVDELGGADVPQVFVEKEGKVMHILTKVPIDSRGMPDFEAARQRIAKALSD